MKQIFKAFFLLIASIAISCNKTDSVMLETNTDELTAEDAKKEFAIILSKAVADNKDLRHFIKNEAIQRFDCDNDVFYPYIKDKVVSEGLTFKEILSSYADTDRLELLEYVEPRLNILVPDWSWLGAFSVNDWNPDDAAIAVGYETDLERKPIYADGAEVGELSVGQFPSFPTLIVKSNERMVQTATATKSSPAQYAFADEAFDGSKYPDTKVEHEYYEIGIDGVPYVGDYMSANELNSYVIGAYDEFGDDVYAAHRDYIYFGMTNSNQEGRLNPRINERIHKIKFRNNHFSIEALTESGDFGQIELEDEYKINDCWKSAQDLRNKFYADGNIELRFLISIGNIDDEPTTIKKMVTASFSDVFAISKSDLDYRHKTWFCKDWFIYTVDPSYYYPKWFTVDLRIPNWDISSQSSVVMIEVEEWDDGAQYTHTSNMESTYMQNFEINASLEGGLGGTGSGESVSGDLKYKVGLGYGNSSSTKMVETVTTVRTDVSDDLGTAYLNYMDPVVIGEETRNGVAGYNVKTFSTGVVDMMILPIFE